MNVEDQINSFINWGGKNWKKLFRIALVELLKDDKLNGAELLDIGTRYGEMAVFFALQGANVTGIDINQSPLESAQNLAKKHRVSDKTRFIKYEGDLDIFPDSQFDIVFTKSVLVVVPELDAFLRKISKKLKSGGKIVFIENARGPFWLHLLRKIKHRNWRYDYVNFFTDKEVKCIKFSFNIDLIKYSYLPPIYLFIGSKRE